MIKIIILLVCFIIYLIYRLDVANAKKRLSTLIAWYRKNRRFLYSHILSFQKDLNIPANYLISSKYDQQFVEDILSIFIEEQENMFFSGKLKPIRSMYVIREPHYFAWMLFSFLSQHWCDSKIAGHNMHEKEKSRKVYGEEAVSSDWDATYALTPFGFVYYKLFYILHCFLGKSRVFSKMDIPQEPPEYIKKSLEYKEITIRYRKHY